MPLLYKSFFVKEKHLEKFKYEKRFVIKKRTLIVQSSFSSKFYPMMKN